MFACCSYLCTTAITCDSRNAIITTEHGDICRCADLLVKCKGITDPTLAVVVDKIKKTVSACPCGLKYKELTDKVAEQTATTGASDICSTEIQKIIQGTVCLRTNMLVASVHSRHVICFSLHTHLATKLPVFLAFPHFCIFVLSQFIVPLPAQPSKTIVMALPVVVQI